jgi:ferric-dicitrate binding protein FerR (iron transport regulator)
MIPEALLIKYLAGEATPEEARAVDDWAEASPDNNRLLQQFLQLWSHAAQQGAYIAPDLQAEWSRLTGSLAKPAQPQGTAVRRLALSRWAAAAVLLILIGAALFIFLQPRKAPLPAQPMLAVTASRALLHDTLPDRSTVVLSAGSRLERPASFDGQARTVRLQGEAFFSVTPDVKSPFIVHAGDVDIKVIGTAFNVKTGKDSVVVQVESGAVLLFNATDSVVIKGGMQGVYRAGTRSFHLTQAEDANDYAYATRVFRFQDTRLESVAKTLEKAYNIKIVLENEKLADCTISTAFADMPLQYVLEVIAASLAIQYRIDGSTIYLQGNECN